MNRTLNPLTLLQTPGLRIIAVWTFFDRVLLLTPFFAIFLAARLNVSTAEIAMLYATYTAARLLTELPFGVLADRFGEARMLRLASLLALIAALTLAYGPMPALFVGQVFFAMSESASSGIRDAYLYRLCKHQEDQHGWSYNEAQPAIIAFGWSGIVFAGVTGTLLAMISMKALGLGAVFFATIALAVTIWLETLPKTKIDHNSRDTLLQIKLTFFALLGSRSFCFWFCTMTVLTFVLTVSTFVIQPLLVETNLAGPGNGLLYSAVTVLAVYGAHLTNWLKSIFRSSQHSLIGGIGLLAVALGLLLLAESFVTIFVAMAFLRFAWGWLGGTMTPALNASIPDDTLRATILSASSLAVGLLGTVTLNLFAVFEFSTEEMLSTLLIIVGIVGVSTLVSSIWQRMQKENP